MKRTWMLAALAGLLLCACSDQKSTLPDSGSEPETQAESQTETQNGGAEYPYAVSDLGGYDFTILNCQDELWGGSFHVIDYDQQTGESVKDALYQRARTTEEIWNIKLHIEKSLSIDKLYENIQKTVMAGDTAYDAAYSAISAFGEPLTGTYGVNLFDVEGLHLNESWWNQSFIENITLNDTLYSSIDYVNMMGYGYVNVLYFNKDMFNKLDIELPYDAVRNGTWTYDQMHACMQGAVNLNGDSAFKSGANTNAVFGYAIQHEEGSLVLLNGSGEFLITTNENGYPEIRTDLTRMEQAYSKLLDILSKDGFCLMQNGAAAGDGSGISTFREQHALFYQTSLGQSAADFRDLDFEYGILPMPKLDAAQDSYYSMVSEYTLALMVPKSAGNPAYTGNIIDYMAYLGYRDIIPVMQETFCYKGLRDEDSIEMMNVILDTITVDCGYFYGWTKTIMKSFAADVVRGKNRFASSLEKNSPTIEKNIDKTMSDLGQS